MATWSDFYLLSHLTGSIRRAAKWCRPAACAPQSFAIALLISLALPVCAFDRLYTEAVQAIDEGIPQVGIQKLRAYLAGKPTPEGRATATLRLADALIIAGQPAEARRILQGLPETPERQFLLVQSRLAAREWDEALRALGSLTAQPSQLQNKALFARAEALRGLGQLPAAAETYLSLAQDPQLGVTASLRGAEIFLQTGGLPQAEKLLATLKPITEAERQTGKYLQAQLALAKKDFSRSATLFKELQANAAFLSSTNLAGVHLGLARAWEGLQQEDEAENTLEKFLNAQPESPALEQLFAELDRVYAAGKDPSSAEMRRWTRDEGHPRRQALAIFYVSRFDGREKGVEAAQKILQDWVEKFPHHPMLPEVLLEYGRLLTEEGRWSDAVSRLEQGLSLRPPPALTGRLLAAAGKACFGMEKFEDAAGMFAKAANVMSDSAEVLLYNSALCWLRAGDFARFLEMYQAFSRRFAESDLRRDLLVEEGFHQARSGVTREAKQTLELFTRDFPDHRRVPEVHLALAELAFTATPPDPAGSTAELRKAEQAMPSGEISEQAAYLRLFQDELSATGQETTLIAAASDFLQKYPASALLPEVRMKLGEVYFRQKDFANARTQFEVIAKDFPESPLLEKARFLSGQSAIRSMNPEAVDGAIETLEQVVRMKGPLQLYARYEQARVKSDTGKFNEALVLYDDLLGKNPEPDLAAAALAGKGETLYLRGAGEIKSYGEAVTAFDQVASMPSVSLYWRHLALYKKGKALEKLGKMDDALTAYYDVINADSATQEPEYLWYYRAGFDAAQILEGREQWEAAIAIYKKLADSAGPRSAEAKERLERLRLEHFIWDK